MSLTSKQIDKLRAYAADRKGVLAKLINDAADTIEMLSAKLHASQMERSSQYYHGGWIPVDEKLPEADEDGYSEKILVSFRNFSLPDIGEYRVDGAKGTDFYIGDMEKAFSEYGLEVNAWMPLPKPYKGDCK